MTGLMARFKVKTRINAGFFVVLALLAVVAVLGVGGVQRAIVSFDTYSDESADAIRFTTIDRNVAELRRVVAQFAATGTQDYYDRITEMRALLDKDIAEAGKAAKSAEEKEGAASMAASYATYGEYVDKVAGLRAQRDTIYADRLVPLGETARADLAEIVKSALADGDYETAALAGVSQEALLAARMNALRFLNAPDRDLGDQTQVMIEAFDGTLDALVAKTGNAKRKQLAVEVNDIAPKYLGEFRELMVAVLETHVLISIIMPQEAATFAEATTQTRDRQMTALAQLMTSTDADLTMATRTAVTIAAAALVLGLALAWVIGGGIVKPIVGMTDTMTKLAAGNKTIDVPALDNKDEIGEMAKAVQVFKENALAIERMQAEQEALKRRAEEDKKRAMNELADSFESSVKGVVQTVSAASTEMQATAESLSAVAEQASRQATAVAAASEEASTNVQTVASAAEELTASIGEISRQVAQAAKVSNQAVDEAKHTNQIVLGLAEAAKRIGEVVSLINDIASQTNLLALNATIEAARAGDAGKGFAVVAGEVKQLANQTAKATDEIGSHIDSVQKATDEAVTAIGTISHVIAQVSEISSAIASAVEEQGAATQEIARNVEQAAAGTKEVSSNICGVTEAANEAGQGASQVLDAAGELSRQSETLSLEVDNFIQRIRTS